MESGSVYPSLPTPGTSLASVLELHLFQTMVGYHTFDRTMVLGLYHMSYLLTWNNA